MNSTELINEGYRQARKPVRTKSKAGKWTAVKRRTAGDPVTAAPMLSFSTVVSADLDGNLVR